MKLHTAHAVIQEQLPLGNLYSILYKAQQTAKDATWHISNMKESKQNLPSNDLNILNQDGCLQVYD